MGNQSIPGELLFLSFNMTLKAFWRDGSSMKVSVFVNRSLGWGSIFHQSLTKIKVYIKSQTHTIAFEQNMKDVQN